MELAQKGVNGICSLNTFGTSEVPLTQKSEQRYSSGRNLTIFISYEKIWQCFFVMVTLFSVRIAHMKGLNQILPELLYAELEFCQFLSAGIWANNFSFLAHLSRRLTVSL